MARGGRRWPSGGAWPRFAGGAIIGRRTGAVSRGVVRNGIRRMLHGGPVTLAIGGLTAAQGMGCLLLGSWRTKFRPAAGAEPLHERLSLARVERRAAVGGAAPGGPARIKLRPGGQTLLYSQNDNVHPDGDWASVSPGLVERVASSLQRTAQALAAARAAGVTVIHVHNAWRDGHPDINRHAPWQADAKEAGRSTEGTWG